MKTQKFFTLFICTVLFFTVSAIYAQSSINGSVVDSENGEAIPGATIIVKGSNTGTASDFDGNFSINTSSDFPLILEVSSIGFSTAEVTVNSVGETINVQLKAGQFLDEVIVSASRRSEKILDAPASVSLITSADIKNSAEVIDPVRHLINTPGVTIQQQTANSMNIEMRGGNGVFGTGVLPLLDYRSVVTTSARTYFSYQYGVSNLDLERIEVVRGTGSVMYGPGVEAGVVHYLTKKPIDYPGTSAEVYGGNLSSFGGAVRHAYSNEKKTFGYKVNVKYNKGDDFSHDPVEDAALLSTFYDRVVMPNIKDDIVDVSADGIANSEVLVDRDYLDPDGDGNMLLQEYDNLAVNAHLEFRPNDRTSGFISAGFSDTKGLHVQDQGFLLNQGLDYWAQARLQTGGLFAQLAYNYNTGGDSENPSFLYASGNRVVGKRGFFDAQLQYNFDAPNFLNSTFVAGLDFKDTTSDSEYTLWGRNENSDVYTQSGVYFQGTSRLNEKLDLTYALRYDKMNFLDEGAFAPKVALVYKINNKNSIRASYSRGTYTASGLEMYIDFPVQIPSPGNYAVWVSGQIDPVNFDPSTGIELVGSSALGFADGYKIPYGSTHFTNNDLYNLVKGLTIPQVNSGLSALGYDALIPFADSFFANYAGPTGNAGTLRGYNVFNSTEDINQLTDYGTAEWGKIDNIEIGYKGVIGDKLSLAVDFYINARTGFTEFTSLGPTYMLLNTDFINTWTSEVASAFASDPGINAAVQGALTAQYAAAGLPASGLDAATASLLGIPAANLAPDGSLPSVALATLGAIQSLQGQVDAGFQSAANQFSGLINPLAFGVVESDRTPKGDGVSYTSSGYRRYDDAKRDYYGFDVAAEYFLNDNITLWANYSNISQNMWIPGNDDDDGLPLPSYLNTPLNKYRLGFRFTTNNGMRGGLAYQHDNEHFTVFGAGIGGQTPERNLFDANFGFPLTKNIMLDVTATNLFDVAYRVYPGMPVIKRRVIVKASFDF